MAGSSEPGGEQPRSLASRDRNSKHQRPRASRNGESLGAFRPATEVHSNRTTPTTPVARRSTPRPATSTPELHTPVQAASSRSGPRVFISYRHDDTDDVMARRRAGQDGGTRSGEFQLQQVREQPRPAGNRLGCEQLLTNR